MPPASEEKTESADKGTASEPLQEEGNKAQLSILASLLPYVWPKDQPGFRVRVIIAFACLVAAKAVMLGAPFFYGEAVNIVTGQGEALAVAAVPLALVFAYGFSRVGSVAFQNLRDAIFSRVGQRAQRLIAMEVFEHLHNLSLRYHLERRTGGLSRVIERGVKSVDFLLRFLVFSIGPTLLELVLANIVLTVMYSWVYALITTIAVICYMWFTFSLTEWRLKIRRDMNERDTEANTRAIDSLLNYETVKYFTNEDYEAERFDRALMRYEDAAVKSQVSLAWVNFGQAIILNLALVSMMIMAAIDVVAGRMDPGGFVVVNSLLIQLYVPLNMLGFVYREIKQALVDMEKMFGLTRVAPEIADGPEAMDLIVGHGQVEFKDVEFSYDDERSILKRVSFVIPGGKKVAVVGPSGAGKSTLSRLLFRFYDVSKGSILIDGQDLRSLTQDSLRRAIGIVPQDTVLFNDTIKYNIAYADPSATPSAIEEAARLAQIHDFISGLPDGYHSQVGERGLKLSGGEKQRVAIARTILKDPPILILDEATSALDTKTERGIQDALKGVSADRTTLVIAHRLSTVIDADEILVLKEGEIVERGTHAVLLDKAGLYSEMWQEQQSAIARGEEIVSKAPAAVDSPASSTEKVTLPEPA